MRWRPALLALLVVGGGLVAARAFWPSADDGTLRLYGNVDIREVDLGFRVGGRLARVLVDEGDAVEQGDLLAEIDATPFQEAFARAQAEVAARRATLAKLEAGTRPQEIEQARAVLAEREAALLRARRDFERKAELVETQAVSVSVFDDARAALDEAQARVRAARENLDLALAGPREEDVTAAFAQLAEAEAATQQARTALADTELRAPSKGVVLTRIREPGAIVAVGAPVLTLTLVDPVRIRAYVPEPDLGELTPGDEVEVVSDSRPDRPYTGRIGFIAPTAEFTPRAVQTPELRTELVYRFHVIVDEGHGLRQGMPVTVRVPAPPS